MLYLYIQYVMQTVTVDIINDEAIKLLENLESMHLIKVHKEDGAKGWDYQQTAKYLGTMSKQSPQDIDDQLNELRNSWE
jgi:hypothetical protein